VSGSVLGISGFAVFVVATLLWARAARAVRLPANRTGFVLAWLGSSLLGASAFYVGVGWLAGIPAGLAVFGGIFLIALVAISAQEVAADAIRVGEKLRAFSAPDEHDASFRLTDAEGHAILLKFFRGHW
jgi:hypothetical protein